MRLNLWVARATGLSRRQADAWIKQGRVSVNREVVREPFFRVKGDDQVTAGAKPLVCQNYIYLIFNKPKGVTTTRSDRFAQRKVSDFLPPELRGLFPVGRLDRDSTGLLILTNDGDLCYRLTHPKFGVEKEYHLKLKGRLAPLAMRRARQGVKDKGELLRVKTIKILKQAENSCLCAVVVTEGKKRHLRRLFTKLGHAAEELKRVRVGQLCLGRLKPGQYRVLKKDHWYELSPHL